MTDDDFLRHVADVVPTLTSEQLAYVGELLADASPSAAALAGLERLLAEPARLHEPGAEVAGT